MNKLTIFVLFLFVVSFVNPHALGKFLIEEPLKRGETATAYVTIRNNFHTNLEDVNTKLYIYDLGLTYTSISDDIQKRDHIVQSLFMPMPKNIKPGVYLAKLRVGNDKFTDTQHVYVRII